MPPAIHLTRKLGRHLFTSQAGPQMALRTTTSSFGEIQKYRSSHNTDLPSLNKEKMSDNLKRHHDTATNSKAFCHLKTVT